MSGSFKIRNSVTVALSAAMALSPGLAAAQYAPADAPGNVSGPVAHVTSGGTTATSQSVVLPFGKSAIVDLPTEARDVLMSNPSVADAVVRSSRRVYLIGRALGQSNAFIFDNEGRQIANIEIRVEPDVAALNDLFLRNHINGRVHAEAMNASVVLTGTVRSASDADQAQQLASTFLGIAGGTGAGDHDSTGGANSPGITQSGGNTPRVINMIQVEGSEQVLVRVRVVEMSRTLVRQLGINLNYQEMVNQLLPSDAFVNLATSEGFSVNGTLLGGLNGAGGIAQNILRPQSYAYPSANVNNAITTADAGVGGYQFDPTTGQTTFGPAQIQTDRQTEGSIQAFERAGLLRVLAEPNITAISGESARFLAGGEFPVPVKNDQGQVSVDFKPFGVGLSMTPIVLSGGRISLKLSTEVSDLTSDGAISTGDTPVRNADGTTTVIRGITIPALQVRRAETTLEMSSGSSMVLAGLIQERTRHALEGVPGVMNTPMIGSLFRSRDFLNNETELVIIVTPYLVHPARPDQMHTPGDGFVNPSEIDSVLTGRLNAIYHQPSGGETGDRRQLVGPHGHVIE
jgi:pilus assembly protein CpaC